MLSEEKQFGEHTYRVTQLGALVGRKVLFRLGKLLGPLAAGLADPGTLSRALAGLEESDFEWLCLTFAGSTKVIQQSTNGPVAIELSGVFDNHFAGHYGRMIGWLSFCVQVNFANFLEELPGDTLNALKMVKP